MHMHSHMHLLCFLIHPNFNSRNFAPQRTPNSANSNFARGEVQNVPYAKFQFGELKFGGRNPCIYKYHGGESQKCPMGNLHLGNYLGALKNFVSLQKIENRVHIFRDPDAQGC